MNSSKHPAVRIYSHPIFTEHFAGPGHPESPQRMAAVESAVRMAGLIGRVNTFIPNPASRASIESVHDDSYVKMMLQLKGHSHQLDVDTAVSPGSIDAALFAAGAALDATNAILSGIARTAFCVVRPPGHHAERDRAMGFCLFNNVAISAAAAIINYGVRVMIIDLDVHHGNGTQNIFYPSSAVYYVSLHQHPLFPGTGAIKERGTGEGLGYTLNIPLPPGSGDDIYLKMTRQAVIPALISFAPQFVIFSSGFDAHRSDPLGMMKVTTRGFTAIYRLILNQLDRDQIPHIFVLEGGYNLRSLGNCVVMLLSELVSRYS